MTKSVSHYGLKGEWSVIFPSSYKLGLSVHVYIVMSPQYTIVFALDLHSNTVRGDLFDLMRAFTVDSDAR